MNAKCTITETSRDLPSCCQLRFAGRFCLHVKDGASFCYCRFVLHISGYSGFLRNLPTNITKFHAVYDYVEKAYLSKGYQKPRRKLGGSRAFFRDN